MAAYMIVFCKIRDRGRFLEEYGKPTAALLPKFGGEYVVRSPKVANLEGVFGDGGLASVISKWPDRDSIERFYNSPDYAPLRRARLGLAECNIIVVEDPS